MRISHKWLQTFFKKPLPSSEKIAELLTFHIFEVEGIEKKASDDVLDIKVLPDRAGYCLSHEGIARELSALISDNEFLPRQPGEIGSSKDVLIAGIAIEAKDVCHKFYSLNIIGLSEKSSPKWLQDKLEVVGQRSINLLVDLTNFVMLDIGRPLHVFDGQKVKGTIMARYAKEGEKIALLGGKELVLDSSVVVLSDDESALDIANIKGGTKAEMDHFSTHVILVALNMDSKYIRRTSAKLGVKTDSSKRFENGVDENLAERAIAHFAALLSEEDQEAMFSDIEVVGNTKIHARRIDVSPKFITEKLGRDISHEEILACLQRGSIRARQEGDVIAVYPESYRSDLNIPEDIVDEVGRLYGYDNIDPILPSISAKVEINNSIAWRNTVRNFLINKEYSEIYSYTLRDKGEVEIANPLAEDKKFYRSDLQTAMEEKLRDNVYYADLLGLGKIKLFEFGHVFKAGREYMSLSIGVAYKKAKKGERVNDDVKIIRDELFEHIGSPATSLCTVDDTGGIISIGNKHIGIINNIDGIMEIDFDALIENLPKFDNRVELELSKDHNVFKPFSPYPFIVRDVAVFAPSDVQSEDVFTIISRNAGELMVRHELFDVFNKGDQTSYAYRLVFQSFEKTLTDEEINRIMDQVYDALKAKGWTIR